MVGSPQDSLSYLKKRPSFLRQQASCGGNQALLTTAEPYILGWRGILTGKMDCFFRKRPFFPGRIAVGARNRLFFPGRIVALAIRPPFFLVKMMGRARNGVFSPNRMAQS